MARPNFFNENENRTFPFKARTAGVGTPSSGVFTMLQLPDDVIVDCGFIMGPESGFVEGVHTVFLYKISKVSSTQINYEFRCDAPALADAPLIFVRQISDSDYTTTFQESDVPEYLPLSQSESLSLSESEFDIVCGEPFWSGYLATGSVSSLSARLSVGTTITRSLDSETLVNEGLIQNLNQSQAVSLNVANSDRTRALRPEDCPANEWPFTTGEIYINKECMQGDIVFSAGYNNLLEGDFYCNEALRTINGLQGPNLTFFAGTGVAITQDSSTSTIEIDVNLVSLSLCTFSISESV